MRYDLVLNPSSGTDMLSLSWRDQFYVGLLLSLVMVVTRSHHFIDTMHVPDASNAIFFLVGFYLRVHLAFVVYFVLAVILDCIAINWAGVSSFCITPAYIALLPAYAVLWFVGRWCADGCVKVNGQNSFLALIHIFWVASAAALTAELIASGSFYFFGGRFATPTLAGFMLRLLVYFPRTWIAMMLYISITTFLHGSVYFAWLWRRRSGYRFKEIIKPLC